MKKMTAFIMTLVLLSLLVLPIAGHTVYAVDGSISSLPVSIKAYPVSTENNTPAFASKGDSKKSGTIYATDLCTIIRIDSDGWLYVTYPTSNNRTRSLFVRARDFFSSTSFQKASVIKYATAYRRSSGSASIGSVDSADKLVYVIGSPQNNRAQIVYKVTNSNYYKMGWVSTDALSKTSSTPSSLTFSPSSLTLTAGTSGTVNVKFSGDDIRTLNVASSNTSVCTVGWGSANWGAGTATLTVNGKSAGTANITVSFINSSGAKFYSKSFVVTVKAKANNLSLLAFSPSSLTLTAGTSGTVNVKFAGDGIRTLNVASSNTSVCTAGWGSANWEAGTATLTVNGKSAGTANITVSFINSSGAKFYSKSFAVTVKAKANNPSALTFSPSSLTLTAGTSGTVNVKFAGDGIRTLNVASSNTSVCTVRWGVTDWGAGTSTLIINGKSAGTANITVSFLNSSGEKFYSKSFKVNVVSESNIITNSNYDVSVSNPAKENSPHYENTSAGRSESAYNKVIDQFNVQSNKRYQPASGRTYCNIFAWDVMSAMNVSLPHWIKNNEPATSTTSGANELNANAVYNWLQEYGASYGWSKVDNAYDAQKRANDGYPTIAIWKNTSGASGHVAVVRPEGNGYTYTDTKGPVIAQAGASNYNYCNVKTGFGANKMSAILYWTHD